MSSKYAMSKSERETFVAILDQLRSITSDCRADMHEPDEQELSAKVRGRKLDNAAVDGELVVTLKRIVWGPHDTKAQTQTMDIHLADLIALARMAKLPPAFDA